MRQNQTRRTYGGQLETLTNTIREDIMIGKYNPGDFLPSEKYLAKQYGLSNKTVRVGLKELVSEGLIEKIARVGNRVVSDRDESTVTVKFGYYHNLWPVSALDKLLAAFRKKHPAVRIRAFPIAEGHYRNSVYELMEKDELDVLAINNNGLVEFSERGDLDKLQTLELNSGIYPFLSAAMSFDGCLKAQPFVFSPIILCYNKDHFREQRLPEPDSSWHWHDLLHFADLLSVDHERLGFYAHYLSPNRWPLLLLQNQVVFQRDPDGMIRLLGTPLGQRLLESVQAYRQLISAPRSNPLFLSENDDDALELFFNGKVSMILTTYTSLNHHVLNKKIPFEYDISPLPYLQQFHTLLVVIGLAVNSRSKVKDSARQLVDFLVSVDAQTIIRKQTVSISSLKIAAESTSLEDVYRPSRFQLYREIVPTYRLFTDLGLTVSECQIFLNEAKLYWSGLSDEETFLMRLENNISTISRSDSRYIRE